MEKNIATHRSDERSLVAALFLLSLPVVLVVVQGVQFLKRMASQYMARRRVSSEVSDTVAEIADTPASQAVVDEAGTSDWEPDWKMLQWWWEQWGREAFQHMLKQQGAPLEAEALKRGSSPRERSQPDRPS